LQAIAPSEDILFLLWEYDTNDFKTRGDHFIFFKRSLDAGRSFEETVTINTGPTHCFKAPRMTVSGNNVYIVWQDYNTTSGMEHVMLSVSNDGGMTFSDPYVLGNGFLLSMSGGYSGPVVSRTGRHIAADGDNLYAIWLDTDSDSRLYHLVFRASDDGAESFGDPIVLARAGYDEIHSAALSATGSNVHVSWVNGTRRGADSPVPLEHSLIARSSHDAGESFENEQIVHTAHQELTIIPDMAATEDSLYLVWTQDNDLMFSKSEDAGTTFSTPLTISTNRKLAEGTPERYIFQFYPFITTFESGVGANDHGTMIAWLDKEAGNDKQYLSSVMSLDSGDTFDRLSGLDSMDRCRLSMIQLLWVMTARFIMHIERQSRMYLTWA
jgi:hypothetical protein